ncbi:MAG: transposase [Elusimicrobia bacterium]|nr:transposase [Elusimicrobiota bacterium]
MSTPPRIAYPGAHYHIIVRGNNKSEIFIDERDKTQYIDILKYKIEKFQLKIYGYVLMPNHIHLFLETQLPNISEAMHRLNLDYTLYFNKRHKRSGHLFGSRFKSRLIQKDKYFLALLRYIHLNPVKAGLVNKPEDYQWSSHKAYLSEKSDVVENIQDTLILFNTTPEKAKTAYVEFINNGIPSAEWKIFNKERNGILGDSMFKKSVFNKR